MISGELTESITKDRRMREDYPVRYASCGFFYGEGRSSADSSRGNTPRCVSGAVCLPVRAGCGRPPHAH